MQQSQQLIPCFRRSKVTFTPSFKSLPKLVRLTTPRAGLRGFSTEYPSLLIIDIQYKHTWVAVRLTLVTFKVYLVRTSNKFKYTRWTRYRKPVLCGYLVF